MDKLSKTAIDKLGRELRTLKPGSERYNEIIKTISDWREQHGEIMNYYFSACKNILKNPPPTTSLRLDRAAIEESILFMKEMAS